MEIFEYMCCVAFSDMCVSEHVCRTYTYTLYISIYIHNLIMSFWDTNKSYTTAIMWWLFLFLLYFSMTFCCRKCSINSSSERSLFGLVDEQEALKCIHVQFIIKKKLLYMVPCVQPFTGKGGGLNRQKCCLCLHLACIHGKVQAVLSNSPPRHPCTSVAGNYTTPTASYCLQTFILMLWLYTCITECDGSPQPCSLYWQDCMIILPPHPHLSRPPIWQSWVWWCTDWHGSGRWCGCQQWCSPKPRIKRVYTEDTDYAAENPQ